MKWTKTMAPLLAASLLLAACGSISAAAGAKKMKETLTTLQKDIVEDNAAAAKKDANQLEETWKTFEDNVKKGSPDLYEKVETPLHAVEAGAQSDKLDKATMTKSISDLSAVLDEVAKMK